MIHFSLINTSEFFGNNLLPTATNSGLSTSLRDYQHQQHLRENMGNSNLNVGGTMPKMSMSLLRENNNRYVSFCLNHTPREEMSFKNAI